MQADQYAEKIRHLVEKGETNQAINELSQLANNSPWLHGVIMQSARYNNIKRQILLGVVPYETANIEINQINYAILEITKEIGTNTTNEFSVTVSNFENRTPKEQLKNVVEIVYSVAEEILNENQKILSKIFVKEANKRKIAVQMTNVFHQQKSRGSFSRWITFLNETEKNPNHQKDLTQEAKNLASILQDFHNMLYSYIPNFNLEKIKEEQDMVIVNKFIMSRLFDFSDEEAKELVQSYLERIRVITQEIGAIAEKVNLLNEGIEMKFLVKQ